MANFNTYQTRQLYVVKAVDSSLDAVGDIYLKTTANGKAFFNYFNADEKLTATDVFDPKNIISLKKTTAAEMDTPLLAHTITVDSSVSLANLVGKSITLTINVRQFMSYDMDDCISVVAGIVGDSSNTASNAAFNKAIAKAIVNAVPKFAGEKPFKVFIGSTEITKDLADGSYPGSGSLIIVEAAQKYIRGKMAKEAFPLTISSNVEGIAWAVDTVAPSAVTNNTVIPSVYAIADLEAFALGERGDYYRGSNWPNNYEPTYMVDLSKSYDMVSIEYYWQGGAENVQKSPRMIQIACEVSGSGSQATSAADTIYSAVSALMGGASGSGAGA